MIIVFTNNNDKLREFTEVFAPLNIPVVGYRSVFETEIEVEETGTSFEENARLKVNALPNRPNTLYLADDSGIEVDCLQGAPGIFSARYGGKGASSHDMSMKLLNEVGDNEQRGAQYRCCIALKFPDSSIVTTEGIVRGTLIKRESYAPGPYGFGYDPIFQPLGFSTDFSNIPSESKHEISHRGIALKKAYFLIEKYKDKG